MKISVIVSALIFIALLPSCMTIDKAYVQEANYENGRYKNSDLKRKNIVIAEVVDNRFPGRNERQRENIQAERHTKSEQKKTTGRSRRRISDRERKQVESKNMNQIHNSMGLGLLDNNMFVDYYYQFDDPLNIFAQESLERILTDGLDEKSTNKIPVKVEINNLSVYDEWGFWSYTGGVSCNLTFTFIESGEEKIVKTRYRDSFSSVEFINERVQYLVYDAIYECADQFIREYDKSNPGNIVERDSTQITEIYDYKKAYIFDYTLFYHFGDELLFRGGLGLTFGKNDKDSWFQNRYAAKFSLVEIKSSEGRQTYPELGIGYSPIIYSERSHQGLFLNPQIELVIGEETFGDDYSYSRYSTVGMNFSGNVGYKIGSFNLKAGVYWMKIFNSVIIDTDTGFLLEIGFSTH